MDYIKGKELFSVIRDIGLLNKTQTLFYGASIMLAVNYLHQRKFVFRDIKPENVMVLENGYIKIIDFGTAKAIEDKTKTTLGTPHYMAPEMILGKGYSFEVDFWAIAVCMYEFICGEVPFGDDLEDTMEIYLAIKNE
jgi:cGMP-dependent protein kinase